MTSPRWRPARPISRRDFLRRSAALSAAAWAWPVTGSAGREAWARTSGTITDPTGTTLERTIATIGDGPYHALGDGPGWPIEVRDELVGARSGREGRRRTVACFLHVTDFQIVDAQSPARVEFFDRTVDPPTTAIPFGAAQRPQEALVCHTVEALVRRTRQVTHGPVTGAPIAFTIATGDNIDNIQANEMRWFLALMDGGELAPNSGAPDAFEGVQSFDAPEFYDPHYWHPEEVGDPRGPDQYKTAYGFPSYPGLLDAAITPITAVGLTTPWYSAFGNHDGLVQGNAPANPLFDEIARGPAKVLAPPPGLTPQDLYRGLVTQDPTVVASLSLAPARPVTPDPERGFITAMEYVAAHLASPARPGPVGHGFTEDNLDEQTLYYTFDVAPRVLGITLDTTSPGSSEGSIGQQQLEWLEQRLVEVHSRYFDGSGTEVTTGNDDRLVVIFSHHRPASMQPIQGPDHAGRIEERSGGDAVLELLHRFPNVVLWVNGHSHYNRVVAHPDPAGRTGGLWDITTSAQIDPPQQARILELVDNRDGTLSIFTTIIDHAAQPATEVGAYDLLGLAAISRELSYNDFQSDVVDAIGAAGDRNVELLVTAPFTLHPAPSAPPPAGGGSAGPLPSTGGGVAATAVGAAVAGALALRRRGGGSAAATDPGRRD